MKSLNEVIKEKEGKRCIDAHRAFMKYKSFRYHFEVDMRAKGRYKKGWYPQQLWINYYLEYWNE